MFPHNIAISKTFVLLHCQQIVVTYFMCFSIELNIM